jgi:hypothetical protein
MEADSNAGLRSTSSTSDDDGAQTIPAPFMREQVVPPASTAHTTVSRRIGIMVLGDSSLLLLFISYTATSYMRNEWKSATTI